MDSREHPELEKPEPRYTRQMSEQTEPWGRLPDEDDHPVWSWIRERFSGNQ